MEILGISGFHNTEAGQQFFSRILNKNDGKIRSLLVVRAAEELDFGSELLLIVQPLPLCDFSCERMSERRAWERHRKNGCWGCKSAVRAFVVAHYLTNKKYR